MIPRTLIIAIAAILIAVPALAADKTHAVIVIGTEHYSPQNSMPVLAKEMEQLGFRVTLVMPDGDPEQNKNGVGVPGVSALDEADLAIFFMRFLTLDDKQFAHVYKYVRSGKPVVAFRTSTHAFKYPKDHPRFKWNTEFGRDVLGTRYIVHQSGTTECSIIEKHARHPILTGVSTAPFTSAGSLYLTSLQPGCVPLVLGTGERNGERLVENDFGTFYIREIESDIVAWTWENKFGARVFSTSFGHVGDFAVEPAMRIILNGILWAADKPPLPADAKVNTYQIEELKHERARKTRAGK